RRSGAWGRAGGRGGGGEAPHLAPQMRLRQPPVLTGGLDGGGGLDGLAERLHRNARRRSDVLVDAVGVTRRSLHCVRHHLPTSLILAFSLSGSTVAVGSPRWYLSSTVVRRPV